MLKASPSDEPPPQGMSERSSDHVIRVMLADDHPSLREGVKARLLAESDFQIVGEAETGPEALRMASELTPDVILLDMELPELSGLEIARQLIASGTTSRILILSAYSNEEYVARLLDAGVAGYLTKSEPLETIVAAIRGVAGGEVGWLSRSVAASLISSLRMSSKDPDDPVALLSDREREVLQMIAHGSTNQEIGDTLYISESTVKKHINNIYFKLEHNNRAELVAWCWKHGIATAGRS